MSCSCTRGGGGYGRPSPRREHACQCNCPSHSAYPVRWQCSRQGHSPSPQVQGCSWKRCPLGSSVPRFKAAKLTDLTKESSWNRWCAARFSWPPRRPWPGPLPRPPPVGLPAWVCLPALLFQPFAAARLAACRRCRWPRPTTSSSPSLVRARAPPATARRAAAASVCINFLAPAAMIPAPAER